jgi:hypothetical protein
VTGEHNDPNPDSSQFAPEVTRRRLAALAVSIAGTEDRVADTFERMALACPEDAAGLLARAAQARYYATLERNRAATFQLRR